MTGAPPPAGGSLLGRLRERATILLERRRVGRLVRRARRLGEPLRVVLGAGGLPREGWIATDIDTLNVLDEADWGRLFAPAAIDALLAEHVWEHLTEEQGLAAARNCLRFLKPGGHVRVAVPDGLHPDPAYLEQVRPGGSGAGAGDHRVLYTCASLGELFRRAGFAVRLLEYHDEGGRFVGRDWEPRDGLVSRSARFDPRNREGRLAYTSIIIDAVKPVP